MDLPHTLTPTDIMDLRTSMHSRGADGTNGSVGAPFIVYVPSDQTYALHCDGLTWAVHRDPTVLCSMLRCERAERGFIRRVLSATEPCDVASLAPDARAAHEAAQRAEARKRLAYEQAEREAVSRRLNALDASRLTLDFFD